MFGSQCFCSLKVYLYGFVVKFLSGVPECTSNLNVESDSVSAVSEVVYCC